VDRRRLPQRRQLRHPHLQPDQLRTSTQPLLTSLAATGCSRVAIHFDVDTGDSNEIVLGLGAVPNGPSSQQVRRIVADVTAAADVVALTVPTEPAV
jgi:arginase